jgi:dolichol kinase
MMFGITEIWRKVFAPHAELTRKLAHVTAGFISMSFPFVFQSPWTVIALAGAFAGLLVLARSWQMLRSINGIDRMSYGEILFPPAIAITFLFASYTDTGMLYIIAVAVLAISDALAGLIGEHWGRYGYRIGHAVKTVEGSVVFALSAAVIVFVGQMVLLGTDPQAALLIAVLTAPVISMVEAIMPFGTDNAVIPICTWLMLLALS